MSLTNWQEHIFFAFEKFFFSPAKLILHLWGLVTYAKNLLSFVPLHTIQIQLVLGSQISKVHELNKRSKDPKNLDLGQNFPGSTSSKDLLNKPKTYHKCVELYQAPQQIFTELCRSPVSNIPQGSDQNEFCMIISCQLHQSNPHF